MRIADAFTLAGNRWHVKYKPQKDLLSDEGTPLYGECHEAINEIWIYKRLGPVKRLQTFIHEVAHALLYTMGYLEHDEVMIEAVSQLVYQLILTQEFIIDEDVGDA